MTHAYPLRLRDDWHAAYTGYEDSSATPYALTERIAENYLRSVGRFNDWLVTDGWEAKNALQKMDGDEIATLHRSCLETLVNVPGHVARYVMTASQQSITKLRHQGLQVKVPFPPGETEKLLDYIQQHPKLTFAPAVRFWMGQTNPEFAQPALLHIGDALTAAEKLHPKSEPLSLIRLNYNYSGLEEAVAHVRAVVPAETPAEKAQRMAYQDQVMTLRRSGEFAKAGALHLDQPPAKPVRR